MARHIEDLHKKNSYSYPDHLNEFISSSNGCFESKHIIKPLETSVKHLSDIEGPETEGFLYQHKDRVENQHPGPPLESRKSASASMFQCDKSSEQCPIQRSSPDMNLESPNFWVRFRYEICDIG